MSSGSSPPARDPFLEHLDRVGKRVEKILLEVLQPSSSRTQVIYDAMRYTALSGGKRLRPGLVVLAYEACGGKGRKADRVAAAVEMVHAFSLIHDDLPAMDDDDMRRGKPSNHKVFGEGVAILAGDALLAFAFQMLSELGRESALGPAVASRLVAELSTATGADGVVGGQVLDLLSEGQKVPRATVSYIHRHKTACLFAASLRLGALAAGGSVTRVGRLTRYGESVGTAFQIVDDILGAAGSFRELGRDPGRDQAREKVTYPRVVGIPASHRSVSRLLASGRKEIQGFRKHRPLFEGFIELVDRRRRDAHGNLLGDRETS